MQDQAGTLVILREFFAVESPPALRSGDGDVVPGELARILVDLSDLAVLVLLAERDTHSASA